MRFFVTAKIPLCGNGIEQSPYIISSDAEADLSIPLTGPVLVDVWICDGHEATGDLMDQWLDQAPHVPKSMLVRDATAIPLLQSHAKRRITQIQELPKRLPEQTPEEWQDSVLRAAELLYARARADAGTRLANFNRTEKHPADTSVLLVGAGIMNLMTARLLAAGGYKVRVVDQGPDPRACKQGDWTSLGVTSGGHNARMFTNTEADNYNEQDSGLYSDMQSIFRRTVRDGGWSVKPPEDFTRAEQDWVSAFERVPGWMAAAFKQDIHEVNVESGKLWRRLMQTDPHLFEDVGYHNDILRLYVDSAALEVSTNLNGSLGALVREPPPGELLESHAGLCPAAQSGHLAGGIVVDGFTVNIHLFVAKLLESITSLGGEFQWKCQVTGIDRNHGGEVTLLRSQMGNLEADHFVVSPGTTGNTLLKGTASENLIHGVLGIWLQIPNLDPKITNSIKIHRRAHRVEDINVTVAKDRETGEDILILGGGYGYVGLDRPDTKSPELTALCDELEDVACIYFPRGYAECKKRGPQAMYAGGHRKFCVRPFTPTGLGIFEKIPTATGGQLIITGGNNTGGFSQAPAIARAVLRSLMGQDDPIHVHFHPDRGKLPSLTYRSRSSFPERLLAASPGAGHGAGKPLKLLLICSDGPQHRYLRYRLDQAFPGYRCVQETSDGQLRQLIRKGRYADAGWQKYHSLRRAMFGHDRQRSAHFDSLVPEEYVPPTPDLVVDTVNCRDVWEAVEDWKPELTIVTGTKFIGKKLMTRAGLMVNLHTGHLPEYKGNHCIFFALYDGAVDKIASTLHQLTQDLDGGDVLDRVSVPVFPTDNEETLYTRCLQLSIDRCLVHIGRFSQGGRLEFVPQKSGGRTFRHRDRTPGKELVLWWRLNVGGLMR